MKKALGTLALYAVSAVALAISVDIIKSTPSVFSFIAFVIVFTGIVKLTLLSGKDW